MSQGYLAESRPKPWFVAVQCPCSGHGTPHSSRTVRSLGCNPSRSIWPLLSSEAEWLPHKSPTTKSCLSLIPHTFNSASNYLINNMLIKIWLRGHHGIRDVSMEMQQNPLLPNPAILFESPEEKKKKKTQNFENCQFLLKHKLRSCQRKVSRKPHGTCLIFPPSPFSPSLLSSLSSFFPTLWALPSHKCFSPDQESTAYYWNCSPQRSLPNGWGSCGFQSFYGNFYLFTGYRLKIFWFCLFVCLLKIINLIHYLVFFLLYILLCLAPLLN